MLSLTFLQAKIGRLAKVVRPDQIEPYPMAAQFKSELQAVATAQEFHAALQHHAALGHCLHVGDLTRPLNDWGRRAGLVDRSSRAHWFVLDIDKLQTTFAHPPQWTADTLQAAARHVLEVIDADGPPALSRTTCVAQATTKTGLQPGTLSMHLFFLLAEPTHAHQIKAWLKHLNFTNDTFLDSIHLSSNGFALCYPVDISCADHGRLVYISPPIFSGAPDPFASPEDRIVLVPNASPRFDLLAHSGTVNPNRLTATERRKKRELREAAGYNPNETEKLRTVNLANRTVELLLNPQQGKLHPAGTARGFCYYNLNDGDSGAYYHEEGRPDIIHNFKGEPAFRWADLDLEGYTAYCEEHADLIATVDPINTFVVVSRNDDRIFKVWHDHQNDTVTLVATTRPQVADFYAEYGKVEPPFLPTWVVEYAPGDNTRVDYTGKTINLFNPSQYMKNGENLIGDLADQMTVGSREIWGALCPGISFLINHMSGGAAPAEQDAFINWLAFIWQFRRKAKTAWIFQGEEGTGKGSLFHEVLQPLFGYQNAVMQQNNVLFDTFDAWRANTLLVAFDEFEIPGNSQGDRALARLRNWITDERGAVRAMHKMAADSPLFENYILFSNRHNILRIPEGDRRYNIFPRQERKLAHACDTVELYRQIAEELPLFASMLHWWKVDEALTREVRQTDAKVATREAAYTTSDEFALALKHGELDYFTQLFDVTPDIHALAEDQLARSTVHAMIQNANNPMFVSIGQLTALFNVLNGTSLKPIACGKMLSRHGLTPTRYYDNGVRLRGYEITFRATAEILHNLKALVARTANQHFQVIDGNKQ